MVRTNVKVLVAIFMALLLLVFVAANVSASSKIAFYSYRDGNMEIYVMNADGTGQTNLTNYPGANDYNPAWSPDGSKIAFYSYRDDNVEIYVMNADGSGQTRLTYYAENDAGPSWSPDGSKIAFTRVNADPPLYFDIYVMNADGSGQTKLTLNPSMWVFY